MSRRAWRACAAVLSVAALLLCGAGCGRKAKPEPRSSAALHIDLTR